MLGKALQADLIELIENRDLETLKIALEGMPPSDLAEIIEELPPETGVIIFRVLNRQDAAEAFSLLPIEAQEALLHSFSAEGITALLNEMPPDDRTRLFEELPGEVTKRLITLLSPEERAMSLKLLGYPEGSVGRLMTPDYIAVPLGWTVQQTMDHIRRVGLQKETANVVYVVDEKGKLLDDMKLRELIEADPERRIDSIVDLNFVSLNASDDRELAVPIFRKYYRVALPVIDSQGILVGIVTVDDVLDVAEQEATEDIQKFGGMEALEDPYLKSTFFEMIKKRIGWLVILFFSQMLTATAMAHFEEQIAKAVVLAVFIPLIISSGGNTGSQAATLVIRAMALGEVSLADWWRVFRRELLAGLLLGTVLGIFGYLRVFGASFFTEMYGTHPALIALTVFLSLIGVVTWGTIVGAMLPLLLRRFGLDPAVSSAPFVATLVDVMGIVIYFTIASVILTGTVL